MLGNFSFGDYFKKEAIKFAWELMTQVYKIPEERLYATVFEDDYEAYEVWLKDIKLSEKRIRRCGEKDNFWAMGDTGPCGPCSELHYDKKPPDKEYFECAHPDGQKCYDEVAAKCLAFGSSECPRFFELWNLVFMEYERHPDGSKTRLPKPSVDTGAGLERLCTVLQGVDGNFKTDLFSPITSHLEAISNNKFGEDPFNDRAFRAIADHIRALVVCISDGVTPSNDGRGYVLRRILRRAFRQGRKLGIREPFLFKLVEDVVNTLGDVYPNIKESTPLATEIIRIEEENFNRTLDMGLVLFDMAAEKATNRLIPADVAFRLYDTYGFPIDLTRNEAEMRDMKVDVEGFEKLLEEQKKRSRKASKFTEETVPLPQDIPLTEFVGYEKLSVKARVLHATGDFLVLDKTPFYAEAGGQISDTGKITGKKFIFEVKEVKDFHGVYIHTGEFKKGGVKEASGADCRARIDVNRRKGIQRAHTATHLLHWALREELGKYVHQSGSLVQDDRLRFDFTYHSKLSDEQLKRIEERVNQRIFEDHKVTVEKKTLREALEENVMAIFLEKYGEVVRVVKIGDFSKELCGGTHTKRTSEIHLFKIISERSVQSGVRRIEAYTSLNAYKYGLRLEEILSNACKVVDSPDIYQLSSSINNTISRLKQELNLHKQKELRRRQVESKVEELMEDEKMLEEQVKKADEVEGLYPIIGNLKDWPVESLRNKIDELRRKSKRKNVAICLATLKDSKVVVVIGGGEEAVKKGFDAGESAKVIGKVLGGSGGGRKDFAQAGGPNDEKIDEALESFKEYVRGL